LASELKSFSKPDMVVLIIIPVVQDQPELHSETLSHKTNSDNKNNDNKSINNGGG
jgi:hypothetical protein